MMSKTKKNFRIAAPYGLLNIIMWTKVEFLIGKVKEGTINVDECSLK
jgi:hypothetical protein